MKFGIAEQRGNGQQAHRERLGRIVNQQPAREKQPRNHGNADAAAATSRWCAE